MNKIKEYLNKKTLKYLAIALAILLLGFGIAFNFYLIFSPQENKTDEKVEETIKNNDTKENQDSNSKDDKGSNTKVDKDSNSENDKDSNNKGNKGDDDTASKDTVDSNENVSTSKKYSVIYDASLNTYAKDACTEFSSIMKDVEYTNTNKVISTLTADYTVVIGTSENSAFSAYTSGLGEHDYQISVKGKQLIIAGGCDAAIVNAIKQIKKSGVTSISKLVSQKYKVSYNGPNTREDYINDHSKFLCDWDLLFDPPAWMTNFKEKQAALNDKDGRMMSAFHRGDAIYYPENSIEGIISAIHMGADTVELDLCLTKDRVVVLLHSNYLPDTTNYTSKNGKNGLPTSPYVQDWTYAQLKQLRLVKNKVTTSYQIPTFEEALKVCKGHTYIWLDKTDLWDWNKDVYPLIKKYQAWDTCFVPLTYSADKQIEIAKQITADSGGVKAPSFVKWHPYWNPPYDITTVGKHLNSVAFWYQALVKKEDLTNATSVSVLAKEKGNFRILAQNHSVAGGTETEEYFELYTKYGVNYLLIDDGMKISKYIAKKFKATSY